MAFGIDDFGRCLSHESEALINGVSTLIKKIPKSYPAPYIMSESSKNTTIYKLENGFSLDTKYIGMLILDFPISQTVKK